MSLVALLLSTAMAVSLPESPRANAAAKRAAVVMVEDLKRVGAHLGSPVFIRIFKREAVLELWLQPPASERFMLFKSFPICSFSGQLGPKNRVGDGQAPEGIYAIAPGQLNPWSQFHLSFNLGYPNAYEQAQGWTGSALMVHGNCVSVGCYAMTDGGIEQIYSLVAAALAAGQGKVPVHAFPFRLEPAALAEQAQSPWFAFWTSLQPIYAAFAATSVPPDVRVRTTGYQLQR